MTGPLLESSSAGQAPGTDGPLLEVTDLHASYGPVRVLHGLSFTVGQGEVVVILGANGAGKTTTLRAISGIVHCSGGIAFDGTSLRGRSPEDIVRRGVAHVPQGRGTVTGLSVADNLRLGAYIRKDDEVQDDLERWYETFPRLRERRDQLAGSLSGGEQQMLAIARALMARPRLLLLDEPSLGLAPLVTREVFEVLGQIQEASGTAMLVVEQNAQLALEIAARAYVLEAGVIAVGGAAAKLRGDESIRRAYLGY
jgi:branched-chain amino acid transport system ATP-binding protein